MIKVENEHESLTGIPSAEGSSISRNDIKIPKSRLNGKPKLSGSKTNTKTIKAPGTATERVAQACDRCRAKKTKCDGRNPCSGCSAVGLECIVSDKLSRRAFPKGYTETLEERIRQLETENKKLAGLLDIRDEQLELLNSGINGTDKSNNNMSTTSSSNINDSDDYQKVTSSNLSLLEHESQVNSALHSHDGSCPCGCSNPHAVHERPVSIAGSIYDGHAPISIAGSINLSDDDDDRNSLLSADEYSSVDYRKSNRYASNFSNREVSPAPGAFAAATAIAQMQKNKVFQQQQQQLEHQNNKQQMLTSLVAISIPRSTEETLFIPTLLARVCQVYGYNSKPSILTANAIASLKENSNETLNPKGQGLPQGVRDSLSSLLMDRDDLSKLSDNESSYFIKELMNLPQSRMDLDHLITVYFQDWGNSLPIVDKNSFLKHYVKLTEVLESSSYNSSHEDISFESIEKFGAIMILVLSLSFLSTKNSYLSKNGGFEVVEKYVSYLNHYDYLIHEFIKPNCIITKYCSIQSLQILSLALQYCLVIGDITTCYELRGRVISMAQQLRLHRCPAAVLGLTPNNDVDLQNFKQGERRILFWSVYCLDVYSSFNLGVPRLFKDYEVECAMPFSGKNDDDDKDNVNILIVNNTKLSIVGKVSKFALSVILYCKVLGNILDSIFSRYESTETHSKALHRDRMLDCWRRELPSDLKFELDMNGLSLKDGNDLDDGSMWRNYSKQQLTLIFLYYHAKILIYLPIISKYGNHHNVGLSDKEKLTKGQGDIATIVSSVSMIQQSSIQILEVLKSLSKNLSSYVLPIPINIAREQARFALLVAKGSLDYIKGGPLYQNSKQLLLDTISYLNKESAYEIPGALTRNSVKLLELSILSILGLNLNKATYIFKKKMVPPNQPITKSAVSRDPFAQYESRPQFQRTIGKSPPSLNNTTNNFDFTSDEMFNSIPNTEVASNASLPPLDSEMGSTSDINNTFDDNEGLESLLNFDAFKVNINRQLLMNEFAADGSLGLVPFLDMTNNEANDVLLNYSDSHSQQDLPMDDLSKRGLFDWT
ncbi:fungal-specific transcription factor domain-containing protein [Scheffersomyces xylosifermentans]|uniref:fungal-specific transcription factor domain-containing protein n=1 Tax=Scheffersomyces xylosifermentans TaxID=1304137 RepID=UPI00315DE077